MGCPSAMGGLLFMTKNHLYTVLISLFSSVPVDWETYFTWGQNGTFIGLKTGIDFSFWQAHMRYAVISNETLLVLASQIYHNLLLTEE